MIPWWMVPVTLLLCGPAFWAGYWHGRLAEMQAGDDE